LVSLLGSGLQLDPCRTPFRSLPDCRVWRQAVALGIHGVRVPAQRFKR